MKKSIKQKISKLLLTSLVASNLVNVQAVQAGQWVLSDYKNENQNLSSWWYQKDDLTWYAGSPHWEWLDGNQDGIAECYAFNENGWMYANTTTPDGYTVNADGAWTENGSVQTKFTQTISQQIINSHNKKSGGGSSSGGSSSGGSSGGGYNHSTIQKPAQNENENLSGQLVEFDFENIAFKNLTEKELALTELIVENEEPVEFSAEELLSDYFNVSVATSSNADKSLYVNNMYEELLDIEHSKDFIFNIQYCFAEEFYIRLYMTESQRKAYENYRKMDSSIESIILNEMNITEDMTQKEAVSRINKWFCKNFSYDYDSFENEEYLSYDMLESLENLTGICHHYTTLFNYFAKACGIESYYVLLDRGTHACNKTIIDGKETYTDVCWNETSNVEKKYFMLTEEEFLKIHTIEAVYEYGLAS